MSFGSMAVLRPRGQFSPLDIPAVTHWWSADSMLWQDSGRTVPAVAHFDLLGAIDDLAPGGSNALQADVNQRAQLALINGARYLYFSGGAMLLSGAFTAFASKRGCIFISFCTHGGGNGFRGLLGTFPAAGNRFLLYESDAGGNKYKFYDGTQRLAGAFDAIDTPYVFQLHRTGDTNLNFYRNTTLADALALANAQPDSLALGLGGNAGGGDFYGLVRDIIVTDDITDEQRQQIQNFMLGRRPPVLDTALGFGDSITNAVGASDPAHMWLHLVAGARSWQLINAGVNGTVLQNTVQNTVATVGGAVNANARDNLVRVTSFAPKIVLLLYGINDVRLNDAAFTATTFETSLTSVVQSIISSGVSAANIVIGSPSYMNNYAAGAPYDGGSSAKHQAIVAKCASVAAAKSTKYIDIYQWMIDHGQDTLIGADGIHPNDAGHQAIANAFLTVI